MSFFGELKHRSVFHVGTAYTLAAWVLIQALSIFLPTTNSSEFVMKAISTLLVAGFPVALVFARIHRTSANEVTPRTGNTAHNVAEARL